MIKRRLVGRHRLSVEFSAISWSYDSKMSERIGAPAIRPLPGPGSASCASGFRTFYRREKIILNPQTFAWEHGHVDFRRRMALPCSTQRGRNATLRAGRYAPVFPARAMPNARQHPIAIRWPFSHATDATRIPELLPIRYQRMAAFSFYLSARRGRRHGAGSGHPAPRRGAGSGVRRLPFDEFRGFQHAGRTGALRHQ